VDCSNVANAKKKMRFVSGNTTWLLYLNGNDVNCCHGIFPAPTDVYQFLSGQTMASISKGGHFSQIMHDKLLRGARFPRQDPSLMMCAFNRPRLAKEVVREEEDVDF
jgi:hypothetical protein